MNEREFVMQYLLNRAQGHRGGIGVMEVLRDGKKAWDWIMENTPDPTPVRSRGVIMDDDGKAVPVNKENIDK